MRDRHRLARKFAVEVHVLAPRNPAKGKVQMHSGLPYTHHLMDVYRNVLRFQHLLIAAGVSHEDFEALEDASWLHDSREDQFVKPKELRENFGDRVTYLVDLVTDEEGPNRKVKHALTAEKTRSDPQGLGVYLKLCDRIANVEAGGDLITMYQREYAQFKRNLYTPGQWEEMWEALETALLIGDREALRR